MNIINQKQSVVIEKSNKIGHIAVYQILQIYGEITKYQTLNI